METKIKNRGGGLRKKTGGFPEKNMHGDRGVLKNKISWNSPNVVFKMGYVKKKDTWGLSATNFSAKFCIRSSSGSQME